MCQGPMVEASESITNSKRYINFANNFPDSCDVPDSLSSVQSLSSSLIRKLNRSPFRIRTVSWEFYEPWNFK